MQNKTIQQVLATGLLILVFFACSKSDSYQPADPCAGVTITVNGTTTNTSAAGAADGSIVATASGGSGITYSLNNGAFQAAGTFNNLAAGTYSVKAKTAAGCSGSGNFTITNGNACAGKTITINTTIENSDKCSASGTIRVEASGSTNFTYRVNASGTYQTEDHFQDLAAGNYTVYARDGDGCETTKSVTIGALAYGTLFSAAKNLVQSKCTSCHVAGHTSGIDFTVDCNIVSNGSKIRAAAVDSDKMPEGGPPLSATEKKTLSDWLDAGGKSSN